MRTFLSLTALTFLAIMNTSVHAQQMNLKLAPNASKVITNSYVWTISATCSIETKGKNKLVVRILENDGAVNGKNLKTGQAMSVVVHNHDSLSVSASPSTKVTLQNKGDDSIQATCST